MATIIHASLFVRFLLVVFSSHARCTQNFITSLGRNASEYAVGALPNAAFLNKSWAGSILVPNTTNDELFFWLFQAETETENLIIWLNGGPGCSSLDGLTKENGPLHFAGNQSIPSANPYSWNKLANVLYIDQPVGTGFASGNDPATTNAIATQDFIGWLKAFYDVFPGLLSQNTYLMGESYAGIYIPYFAQAILANRKSLPINLKSISIGDGTWGNAAAMSDLVATKFLDQHRHFLGIPQDILTAFEDADKACEFGPVLANLTYPPKGKAVIPGDPEGGNFRMKKRQSVGSNCPVANPNTPALVNESVMTCYEGCSTGSTAMNYLSHKIPCFNPYNIHYTCATAPNTTTFVNYLNLPATKHAIHAPPKPFRLCNNTVLSTLLQEFVTPPAYSIMPAILEQGLPVHLYSGDWDFLLNHWGSEAALQNMTWGGKQGFQQKPDRPFIFNGTMAGNWGCERGLSYHHFFCAGHAVPYDAPAAAFAFVRDWVLGPRDAGMIGGGRGF